MKDLMNYAGNILEELKEAETISGTKDEDIFSITALCGGVTTFLCCP